MKPMISTNRNGEPSMKTLYLNPAMNEDTDYPLGTVLKPSATLLKAAGLLAITKEIYVKVVQDPRKAEPCKNCFLRPVSPCHPVFSCISSSVPDLILKLCTKTGEL